MKKANLTIAMVLLIACLPVLAGAQPQGPDSGYGCGPMGMGRMHKGGSGIRMILKLKETLDLSADQVKQLEAIRAEGKGQPKAGYEAVKAKRDALHKAVKSGADEAVIRAAAAELGSVTGDQAVLRTKAKSRVNAVLTETQKTKLKELKRSFGKGKRRMGARRKGHEARTGRKGHGAHTGQRDPESVFTRIDTDGNGSISLEEFKTHMEQARHRRSGKGSRGRRRPRPEETTEEP